MNLPEKFIQNLKAEFPNEAASLIDSLNDEVPVSIRINPFKNYSIEIPLESILWADNGYYLRERPAFYADPDFHSGAYYVQEASSMVLEFILKSLQFESTELTALDMCAAPGGKSTILSTFLENKGVLLCNELVWKRNLILQENLSRWGLNNTIITHNSSKDFRALENTFDLVLIDAPCSGEGMFRKDSGAIREWSPGNIEICVKRQKTILSDIESSIKNGGILIYSTCTYNKSENETQIDQFMEEFGYETIEIDELKQFGIVESNGRMSKFYRLFPHKLKGEGLSITILKKISNRTSQRSKRNSKDYSQKISNHQLSILDEWIDLKEKFNTFLRDKELFLLETENTSLIEKLNSHLKIIKPGTLLGELKGNQLIPSHSLALNCSLSGNIPKLELSKEDALRVLQKDGSSIKIPDEEKSWFKLIFNENVICLAKKLQNRMNIHLPKTFRIRKNLDDYLN